MKLVQSEEVSWQYSAKSGSATPIPSWSLQAGDIVWRVIWGDCLALCCKRLPGESCSCDHAINHLCSVFTVTQVKLCNPCGTSCVQLCSSAFHMGERHWIPSVVPSLPAGCWPWTGWWYLGSVTLRGHLWSVLFFLCISCLWPQGLWLTEAAPAIGGFY